MFSSTAPTWLLLLISVTRAPTMPFEVTVAGAFYSRQECEQRMNLTSSTENMSCVMFGGEPWQRDWDVLGRVSCMCGINNVELSTGTSRR